MEPGIFLTGVDYAKDTTSPVIPAAPTTLAVTAITSGISLSWSNGDTYSAIAVDRSTDGGVHYTALTPAAGAATTYTDSTGVLGTAYTYAVRGVKTGYPSAYSNAVTATPYDPTALSGLQVWLDASNSGSITILSSHISQANDLSGNGNHYKQTSAGNRPTYETAVFNGLNAIRFTKSSSQYMIADSNAALLTPSVTIIAVYRENSAAGFFYGYFGVAHYIGSGNSSGINLGVASADVTGISDIQETGGGATHNDSGVSAANLHVYVSTQDGTTNINNIYVDGVFKSTQTQLMNFAVGTQSTIGRYYDAASNFYANDHLCEAVLYSRVLNAAEITAISNYLKTKWGL